MNFGTIQVADIFVGALNATEAYFGTEKIWEKSTPPTANWLCFTAEQTYSSVGMLAIGSAPRVSLEYSTDGSTWSPFVVGAAPVSLANIGDKVYVRATSAGNTGMGSSSANYNMFTMNGKIAASGNVDTLLDQNGNATLANYCYTHLFEKCPLTTAPELPATTLAEGCYYSMLYQCSSLTTAPELPATTLAERCYQNMFQNCSSLTTAPELPATTLASNCYNSMFINCSSLTTAPSLPATTLANYCYYQMFRGCSSLTTAPELPATTLAISCYQNMFYRCSNLNTITLGYTGNFAGAPATAFNGWVNGVAASGTFYYNGSDTTTGTSAIPSGWTVISTSTKVKYTTASGLSDWVGDIVGSLSGGYDTWHRPKPTSQIPNVLSADSIEVGTHVTSLGQVTFYNCTNLSSVTIPDSVTSIGYLAFQGCSNLMDVTMIGKSMSTVQGMTNYSWNLPSSCVIHCTDGDITI